MYYDEFIKLILLPDLGPSSACPEEYIMWSVTLNLNELTAKFMASRGFFKLKVKAIILALVGSLVRSENFCDLP